MTTLVLRFAGPLQSWGTGASRFGDRDTGAMPTKSGVVGLLANALGRGREDDIADLAAARFAVRTERPGTVRVDYHTARVDMTKPDSTTQITYRHYLHDAEFTAFVELHGQLAEQVASALRAPRRPLFLGRRSCPPEGPVLVGSTDEGVGEALGSWPRPQDAAGGAWSREADPGEPAETVDDQPVTFRHEHRQHTVRRAVRGTAAADVPAEHDPIRFLER